MNRFFLHALIAFSVLLGICTMNVINKHIPIVIEKSSDSDWEYSTDQSIRKDTTITRVVVIKGDTLYPTTEYKILNRE